MSPTLHMPWLCGPAGCNLGGTAPTESSRVPSHRTLRGLRRRRTAAVGRRASRAGPLALAWRSTARPSCQRRYSCRSSRAWFARATATSCPAGLFPAAAAPTAGLCNPWASGPWKAGAGTPGSLLFVDTRTCCDTDGVTEAPGRLVVLADATCHTHLSF